MTDFNAFADVYFREKETLSLFKQRTYTNKKTDVDATKVINAKGRKNALSFYSFFGQDLGFIAKNIHYQLI